MNRTSFFISVSFVLFASNALAWPGNSCCDRCGNACGKGRLVKKTIMVPTVITETRLKSCVINKSEEREETYTVFERVPVTQRFTKETCYLDDEIKTKTIAQTHCKRVKNPVVRTFSVNVPETTCREGVVRREVCTPCGGKVCVEEPCICQ